MIGKSEWFGRRKYTGWGLTPKTWQAWAYLGIMVAPIIIIQPVQSLSVDLKMLFTLIWVGIFAIDFVDIMIKVNKTSDEREKIHEAMADRNALWSILLVIVLGIAYQAAQSVITQGFKVDPVIIIALLVGTIAKAATNIYLDKKD